ncbi:hypothetical protein [Bacillus thuringiensis]|uniref:hypothetical protein n=1 Tax=Bacillus thuringiensis TaxID=1428 RepID=UPI0021D669D9|nr:hypothetical protein [Bacillus thuringiensis]MCU7667441.1 hypothetical protein [Bacillus thuringiensis]
MKNWRIWGIMIVLFIISGGIVWFLFSSNGPFGSEPATALPTNSNDNTKELVYTDLEQNHEWVFKYKKDIKEAPEITVKDEDGKRINVQTKVAGSTLHVTAPEKGYEKGATYSMTIPKGLTLKDDTSFNEGMITFAIKRDAASSITLEKGVIELEPSDVVSYDKGLKNVVLNKNRAADIKKGTIIIIPTKEEQDPLVARKVVDVKKDGENSSYKLSVPDIKEVVKEFDIYQQAAINSSNIELDPDLEGITIESLALSDTSGMVASIGPFDSVDLSRPDDGFIIKFKDFNMPDKKRGLDYTFSGAVHVKNAKFDTDMKKQKRVPKKFRFGIKSDTTLVGTFKIEGEKLKEKNDSTTFEFGKNFTTVTEIQSELKRGDKFLSLKKRIGKIYIPVPGAPALQFKGELMLEAKAGAMGEVNVELTFEYEENVGVRVNKGVGVTPYYSVSLNNEFGPKNWSVTGKGGAEASFGLNIEGGLELFSLAAATLYLEGGIYDTVGVAGQLNNKYGVSACFKTEAGLKYDGGVKVTLFDDFITLYKGSLLSGKKSFIAYSSCKRPVGLKLKPEKLEMKPGQSTSITKGKVMLYDMWDGEETEEEIKMKSLKLKSDIDDIQAESRSVSVVKNPTVKNGTVETSYDYTRGDFFEQTITGKLPVTISDSIAPPVAEKPSKEDVKGPISKEEMIGALAMVRRINEVSGEVGDHGWFDWANLGTGNADKNYLHERFRTIMTEAMIKEFVESNLKDYFQSPSPHAPELLDTNMRFQVIENKQNEFTVRTVLSQTTAEEHGGFQHLIRMKKENGKWKFDMLKWEEISADPITQEEVESFFAATKRPVSRIYKTAANELIRIRGEKSYMSDTESNVYIVELKEPSNGYMLRDWKKEYKISSRYYFFIPSSGYSYPLTNEQFNSWKARNNQ